MVRSKKSTGLLFIVGVFLLVMGPTSAWSGSPGEAGLLSLRLGVGAREAAMGDAGVAMSEGAAAVYWNPANNVFADFETDVIFQHNRWLGLFNQEAAAVAHRVGDGVIGVIFTGLYSDSIDRQGTEPVATAQGTFKPYDVAFGVSYAHPVGQRFAASVTAKLIHEKLDIYSDTGFAFDLGITHQAVIDGMVFSATATNLGAALKLKDDPVKLPRAFRLGAAMTPPQFLDGKLTVAADAMFPVDSTEKAHVGAEYRILPQFVLRVGTKLNYDVQEGLTAGAGFVVSRLTVDYAFQDKAEGFDAGHKFALSLTW